MRHNLQVMNFSYVVTIALICATTTCCQPDKPYYVPYKVTDEEMKQVLQLPQDKQIDAYLERLKSIPSNPILAFAIAPNIDLRAYLKARIVEESNDDTVADLLFLAREVCRQGGKCSQA